MRINSLAVQNSQNFGKLIVSRNKNTEVFFDGLVKDNNDSFEKITSILDEIDEHSGSIPVYLSVKHNPVMQSEVEIQITDHNKQSYYHNFPLFKTRKDYRELALKALEDLRDNFKQYFNKELWEEIAQDCSTETQKILNRYV